MTSRLVPSTSRELETVQIIYHQVYGFGVEKRTCKARRSEREKKAPKPIQKCRLEACMTGQEFRFIRNIVQKMKSFNRL